MNRKTPISILETLYKSVETKFKQTHPEAHHLAVEPFFKTLAQEINQTVKPQKNIKWHTIYKSIYLPIQKRVLASSVSISYRNTLAQFIGFPDFETFMIKKNLFEYIEPPLFDADTTFYGYTYESESTILRFLISFFPQENGEVQVRLKSVHHHYSGKAVKRRNNIHIEVFRHENIDESNRLKSEVVMFVGAGGLSQKSEVLLGIFTESDNKGNPIASRVVFRRTKEEISKPPAEIHELKPAYETEIPSAIRMYLRNKFKNQIRATEANKLTMDDLRKYESIYHKIRYFFGIYEVFVKASDENDIIVYYLQILPSGRAILKSTTTRYASITSVSLRASNLYIELASLDEEKRLQFIIYVGNTEMSPNKVYQGVFSGIATNFKAFAGKLLFFPKKLHQQEKIDFQITDLAHQDRFQAQRLKKADFTHPNQHLATAYFDLPPAEKDAGAELNLLPQRTFTVEELEHNIQKSVAKQKNNELTHKPQLV